MAESLTQAQLDRFAAARDLLPTMKYFGFHLAYPQGEVCEVTLAHVLPEQRGGMGGTSAVNGGVLAALFDFAVGYATTLAPPLRRSATVQLSLNLERAVLGDSVRCVARIARQARSLLFVSAEIFDGEDRICARGNGMCALSAEVELEAWINGVHGGARITGDGA